MWEDQSVFVIEEKLSWKAPDEQDIEVEGGEDGDGEGEEEEEDVGDSRPLVRARPQTELSLTNGFRLSG